MGESVKALGDLGLDEAMTENSLQFTVEGAFLVDTARNLMLSDQATKAWQFLRDALVGDVETLAIAILSGDMTLVGDSTNGITAVEEDQATRVVYLEDVEYIYAGRVRIKNTWWRPRAVITRFGAPTAAATNEATGLQETPAKHDRWWGVNIPDYHAANFALHAWERGRARHYAEKGDRLEILEHDATPRYVVFEPGAPPPFWWTENTDPQVAVSEYLQVGRRLQVESAEPAADRHGDDVWGWGAVEDYYRDLEENEGIEKVRAKIIEQAGDDVFALDLSDGSVAMVPSAPFHNWVFQFSDTPTLPWTTVSVEGWKCAGDDPNHTDWFLGAGGDLQEVYGSPLQLAASRKRSQMRQSANNLEGFILAPGGALDHAIVGIEVLVLGDLRPENAELITPQVRVIITEEGGALAHTVNVARSRNVIVIRHADARAKFPRGTVLDINGQTGEIRRR